LHKTQRLEIAFKRVAALLEMPSTEVLRECKYAAPLKPTACCAAGRTGNSPQPDQEYDAGDDATGTEDRKGMPAQKLNEQAPGAPEQRCQQQKGDAAPAGSLCYRHFNSY